MEGLTVMLLSNTTNPGVKIGSLSKSLQLALIRLPEVNFHQNETLRMYLGCIQP